MISILRENLNSDQIDSHTYMLQLPIPRQDHRLAGFIIESLDGIAIHSRGKDENHLILIYNRSTEPEVQSFLAAWQRNLAHKSCAIPWDSHPARTYSYYGDTHHV